MCVASLVQLCVIYHLSHVYQGIAQMRANEISFAHITTEMARFNLAGFLFGNVVYVQYPEIIVITCIIFLYLTLLYCALSPLGKWRKIFFLGCFLGIAIISSCTALHDAYTFRYAYLPCVILGFANYSTDMPIWSDEVKLWRQDHNHKPNISLYGKSAAEINKPKLSVVELP